MTLTTLPLFPLTTMLFPDGLLPLQIFELRYLNMVKKCIADGTEFGVVAQTVRHRCGKPNHQQHRKPMRQLCL